jgi:FMN phosphatase YigB (HAD superfamily)
VGSMKPSPVPFIAIAQRTGVHPSRILFIGDSFEKDVIGARAVGMTGGLLLRNNFKSQTVPSYEENSEVNREITDNHISEKNHLLQEMDYIIFNNLFPEEMKKKLSAFWDNENTTTA